MTLFLFLSLWFGQGQVNAVENQGAANPQQQATQSPSPVIESGKTGQARDSGNDNQSGTTHWLDPLVLLNFALFVAVLIQAGIYWKQLREMRRTLGILKRQADASERQAGVMESQLEAMQGQLEMMRKQAAAGEAQMDIAVRAVGVAERSAIAAENNVEIAQRAYVLIGKVSPMHISDVCEVVKFQVMNFGNTPANDVQTASRAEVADSEPEELNKDSVDWTSDVGIIIAPHSPIERNIEVYMSKEERRLLNEGELRLYLWGIIRYRDIFGNTRHSRFRFVHHQGTGPAFGHCERGNEAD